jgi:RNA-directed DNA polymerase
MVADIREVTADLNPLLRGRGNYFRTGNAAAKLIQADRYVVGAAPHPDGQETGPEPARQPGRRLDRGMVQRHGLYQLRGTIFYPKAA